MGKLPERFKESGMRIIPVIVMLALAGCTLMPDARSPVVLADEPRVLKAEDVPERFAIAVRRMRPVVIETCKSTSPNLNCDFLIAIDPNPKSAPNAFQTVNDAGQPILAFTLTLLEDMYNADEVAFVIGHEAAHHILRHLERQDEFARGGATLFEVLAAALGGSNRSVDAASEIGAAVGRRNYSKTFELEADRMGAKMTQNAGFDAVRGAAYFTRIPDAGNRFFGTHPRNADRIAGVKAAVAEL
jgi:Zn-dependent protease with chaperone function